MQSRANGKQAGRFAMLGTALKKPQVAFLIIGFIFGMIVLSINPPFRVPDTILHFYKAYAISEGDLTPTIAPGLENGKKRGGSYGPRSFDTMEKQVGLSWPTGEFNVGDVSSALDVPLNPTKIKFYNYAHNGRIVASPIPYLPEAIVIAFGRLFHLSPLVLVYLCGFFNLLMVLVAGCFAITITPVLKWTFVLLGLLPNAVHLAASVSEYAFDIALCTVTIAFFFKLAFDPKKLKVERRDMIFLFVIALLLALSKQPFFLLLLLFLLIPLAKLSSRKVYVALLAGLLVFAVLVTLAWGMVGNKAYNAPEGIDSNQRLKTLFTSPGTVIVDFFSSLKQNFYTLPDTTVASLGNVGQVSFPSWFIYLYLVVVLAVALIDKGIGKVLLRQKLVALGVIIITVLAVFVLLYIYAIVYPRHAGDWLAGRYIYPAAGPLFFLLFYNTAIRFKKNLAFYLAIYGFMIFTIIFTSFKLYTAYY